MAQKPPSRGRHHKSGGTPRAPQRNAASQLKSDARQTSLEAGRALQRMLDAAPGAQVNHAVDASTKMEALRVLDLAASLEVHVPVGVITEAHIDQRIDDMRRQLSVVQSIARDDKLEMADEVLLDLLGYLGGDPFVAHTDTWYTVTPNALLPGLFESLVGMPVPSQRVVHVRLPPNYPVRSQAGRTAVFAVQVKLGRRRELPDLDDPTTLPLMNKGAKTPDELREKVRAELRQERALQMVDHAKFLLLRELYIRCMADEVPDDLVDEELTRRWRGFVGESYIRQGVSLEEQQKSRDGYASDPNLRAEARRTIWELRVCEAVAAHLSIDPSEADLKRALTQIFGGDADLDGVLYKNPQLHKELLSGLRIRRAVDAILKNAKVLFDAPPTPPEKAYKPLIGGQDPQPISAEESSVFTAARGLKRPASKAGPAKPKR
jgi:FKBP-type peptidyl-prolyl cis-trans isomerase (trigger factor)